MTFQKALQLFKQTFQEWNEDKAPRLGAALAYYTVFSIAPLLVILIAIVGFFFGESAVRGEIAGQITDVVGPEAAGFIQTMIQGANKPGSGIIATVIGLATLFFGAMGVFAQLQDALNTIWEVEPKPNRSILETIKGRLTPFVMLIGVAFLLLASLAVSAGIAILGNWLGDVLPMPAWVMQGINLLVSFAIVTGLFAMIFRILPDAEIEWKDVWIGAALTTLLFMIGQMGLGWYVGRIAGDSTYGAAGALVAVLLWVYWTAQILFFGAEFTQVYANKYGSKVVPAPNAVFVSEEARARQGMKPKSSKALNKRSAEDSKEKHAPETRNLLVEARHEGERGEVTRESAPQRSQREFVEDLGSILAGLGIVLIVGRLFSGKEKTP